MSRSGYSDDCDGWALIRWRGAVASATRGARGQAMLREMLVALDAMSDKSLVASSFQADGQFCALGVLGQARGVDLSEFDEDSGYVDHEALASKFGVASALVQEVMFLNDEYWAWKQGGDADRYRWAYMRQWVASKITQEPSHGD